MDKHMVSLTCNSASICEGTTYLNGAAPHVERKTVRSAEEHAQLADGRFDIVTQFVPSAVTSSYPQR